MARPRSAGLLLFRRRPAGPEVLLVHPGGPFWAKRDAGAWSLPKGAIEPDEEPLAAARREFAEELGIVPPSGSVIPLGEVRQRAGKVVLAYAIEGNLDADTIRSNLVEIEWPPRTGRRQSFPEVDRAAWFALGPAAERMVDAQRTFLERLKAALAEGGTD